MIKYPKTVTYSGEKLLKMVDNTDKSSPIIINFRKEAESLLSCPRFSVIDRKLRAESGDPHDYMSMGPYWWPNPDTEDGLPYVRRDGEVNPETVEPISYVRLSEAVHLLSLAALYFNEKKYAIKAVKMLREWHLDEETRMNPHLEYGQSIPGICKGRGIGLIDFCESHNLFNAVAILEYLDAIDSDTLSGLKKWYVDFINWMLTSENGVDEDSQHNNHGTWYDVQIAAAAIFTGRKNLARKTLKAAYIRRVLQHVKPDGTQSFELERTRGIHYSLYNLDALSLLGNMAVSLSIDQPYWKNDGEKGNLLCLAVDYIAPYAIDPSTFPYKEITPKGTDKIAARLLMRAAESFPNGGYKEKAAALLDDNMLWRLYPQA